MSWACGVGRRAFACSRLALAATVVAATLSGAATSAVALPARGHVFASSFQGEGAHAFGAVAGLAVEEATGEVLISDPAHERVERFARNGAGEFSFAGELKVFDPGPIAVDNAAGSPSNGDIYVAGSEEKTGEPEPDERDYVYKFSASGEKIFKKSLFETKEGGEEFEAELEDISGLAVDDSGRLFAYWEEEGDITGFTAEEKNRLIPSLSKEAVLEQPLLEEHCEARPAFALSPSADAFYAAHERDQAFEEGCLEEEARPWVASKLNGAGEAIARDLDAEDTRGLATDSDGDVFADNVHSIVEFTSDGSFVQRFGQSELQAAGPLAVDSGSEQLFAGEEGRVLVFAGETSGEPPSVDSMSAQALSASAERIDAEIDAHGSVTHYYVQYGVADCVAEPSACREVPIAPGAELQGLFGDQEISIELDGLTPNTTYHYRVVAENAHGESEGSQTTETFFVTLPSATAMLADHRAWEQVTPQNKHGAAIESISREGAAIQAATDGEAIAFSATGPLTEEAKGNRRPEPDQVLASRSEGGWSSEDISTPHNQGEGIDTGEQVEYRLFSPDLSSAIVQPQIPSEALESPPLSEESSEKDVYLRDRQGNFSALVTPQSDTAHSPYGGKLEFLGASENLSHVVLESRVPLLAGQGKGGLYGYSTGALTPISLLPGSGIQASEPALGDQGLDTRGAVSVDGTRVFWTEGAGGEGPLYMTDTTGTSPTVTQIDAAQGRPEANAEEREDGLAEVHFQGASADGGRVFFTDTWPLTSDSTLEPSEEKGGLGRVADLYEYDTETGVLSDLSVDTRAGESAQVLGTLPGFSADGSYVYFVADGVLAPGASPGDCPANEEATPPPQAACNLYLSELDAQHPAERTVRLVARLSYQDAGDWAARHSAGGKAGVLGDLTARVSDNGRYLAFMSAEPLTGYDNVEQNPAADGARDQEVYLYDAQLGRLSCASCNPSGTPPRGVYDTERSGEGLGLLVDRPETWAGEWLAGSIPGYTLVGLINANYQSRYLSDAGRLFFDSADPLSALSQSTRSEAVEGQQTQVGVENVYEYEPDGLGTCQSQSGCTAPVSSGTSSHESAFLDASEDGADAFFMTAAPLLASDTDSAFDVYDARICGTSDSKPCLSESPPPPPACTGEGCRSPAATQPGAVQPASAAPGPGNQPPSQASAPSQGKPKPQTLTRAMRLARALKACRRLHHKKERVRCERKARHTYSAKHKPKRSARPSAGRKSSTTRSGSR